MKIEGNDVIRVSVLPSIPDRDPLLYVTPEATKGIVEGARVLVPLGPRHVTGIVVGFGAEGALPKRLREIVEVLDDEPLLPTDVLQLCRFAAEYYLVSLSEVLEAAVLAGLRAETKRRVRLVRGNKDDDTLTAAERSIVNALSGGRVLGAAALARAAGRAASGRALRSLEARGWIAFETTAPKATARPRLERFYVVGREPTPNELTRLSGRAPAQARALDEVRSRGAVRSKDLQNRSPSALRALLESGLLRVEHREAYRTISATVIDRPSAPEATAAQDAALGEIDRALGSGELSTILLHGVTGSGKTEVYLRAAERVLDAGRGVLVLVPEIALTHQIVIALQARFGSDVAILHSGLSGGERFDEWRRLSKGEARIAVGVRSAIFAPVRRLGLVVVDEEHDGAYKQEDGLRYNARDLAIVRARNARCPVLLGSATPSMESTHHADTGRYRRARLPDRVAERPLPDVELVDLREDPPEGEPAVFSTSLRKALEENAASGHQSLLFMNRRGYASYLQCRVCGDVVGCPNCSVALTFHLTIRRLRCHHCDYRAPAPDICPSCGSPSLSDCGIGTEQVEEALRQLLPKARIARLDRDAVARKGSLARILERWRSAQIDVLVGTQMVAKGHDVPGVTLVGVVLADSLLNLPDFRAGERTFQLLTQVAGRAGRGDVGGRVIVQTYRPDHYAIRAASRHDYAAFAAEELETREALRYPPSTRLVAVRFDGPNGEKVERAARETAARLRKEAERVPSSELTILGPAPAPLERVRGRYRWQLLVKSPDPHAYRPVVHYGLRRHSATLRSRGVRVAIDVDPYSLV